MSELRDSRWLKQLAPFHQPVLEPFQPAHVADVIAVADELDGAAAVDEELFFLEQRRQGVRSERRVECEGAPQRMPSLIELSPCSAREI